MKYLTELKKLSLPRDEYAVFGSGPLAIRGLKKNNDLDIVVKKGLWEELAKTNKIINVGGGYIKIGHLEIYKNWKPWFENINNLIEDSDIIKDIRFVKLKYLLEWKKAYNRDKDKEDVKIIEAFLNKNSR